MRDGFAPGRIIIFGRYPVPGKVKTRLIPALGPAGAADLQRRLTEGTLIKARRFASVSGTDVEVCFDGGSPGQMRRWLGPGLALSQQVSGGLGDRMRAAFAAAFRQGCRRVVLIGTDIPGLGEGDFQEAFRMLGEKDLVLGPSTDGGYWLMGLRGPAEVFEGIHWGKGTVLDTTLLRAKALGLRTHLLKPLQDIDTVADLKTALPGRDISRPYVSVIVPALNEDKSIQRCIRSATDPDAEVIAVDGGSRDDTASQAAEAGARVLHGPRGRAPQQNRGAEVARGEVLLFLHADTLLPREYVRHVFECLMDPGVSAGAFRFRTDFGHPLMRLIERLVDFRSRYAGLPYGDQALFMRRAAFRRAGGFPEVPIAEDFFLVRRIASFGRVETAGAEVVTSGRKWRRLGMVRTTLRHQLVLVGLLLGISTRTLARLYGESSRQPYGHGNEPRTRP